MDDRRFKFTKAQWEKLWQIVSIADGAKTACATELRKDTEQVADSTLHVIQLQNLWLEEDRAFEQAGPAAISLLTQISTLARNPLLVASLLGSDALLMNPPYEIDAANAARWSEFESILSRIVKLAEERPKRAPSRGRGRPQDDALVSWARGIVFVWHKSGLSLHDNRGRLTTALVDYASAVMAAAHARVGYATGQGGVLRDAIKPRLREAIAHFREVELIEPREEN